MPIAALCLIAVTLMPILVVGYAKSGGRYDNRAPRESLDQLEGAKRRAYYAHLNCFEALPVFIAALFVAVWTKGPQPMVDALAVGFLLSRILYVLAYIADRAALRSILWSLAYVCALGLFVSGYWAPV